jgi:hypothetical protein
MVMTKTTNKSEDTLGNSSRGDPSAITPKPPATSTEADKTKATDDTDRPNEIGGQKGLEPTRYGDWEKNGRCTDF